MNNLNICIATYSLSPGGVSNFIFNLSECFLNDGNTIEILCTDSKGEWFKLRKKKNLGYKFINFGIWGWLPFGRIIHSIRIGRYLRQQKFDLVINNHSFFIHASSAFFRPQSKLISIIHNQLPFMVNQECKSRSDAIICVSKKIYNVALGFSKSDNLLTIINGADFPPENEVIKNKRDLKKTKLLFVGRIDNRQKGVFLLPEIMRRLVAKNQLIELTIVGIGPDEKTLRNMISDSHLNEFIHFEGLVKPEYISVYYQSHHIILLPSYFEGLPLTIIEAMGNGCIPIATLLPDSTDICIDHEQNGFLIPQGNIDQFVTKTELLIANIDLQNKMRISAILKANEKFSIGTMYRHYLSIIKKVMESNSEINTFNFLRNYFTFREIVPFNFIILIKNKLGLFKK